MLETRTSPSEIPSSRSKLSKFLTSYLFKWIITPLKTACRVFTTNNYPLTKAAVFTANVKPLIARTQIGHKSNCWHHKTYSWSPSILPRSINWQGCKACSGHPLKSTHEAKGALISIFGLWEWRQWATKTCSWIEERHWKDNQKHHSQAKSDD